MPKSSLNAEEFRAILNSDASGPPIEWRELAAPARYGSESDGRRKVEMNTKTSFRVATGHCSLPVIGCDALSRTCG